MIQEGMTARCASVISLYGKCSKIVRLKRAARVMQETERTNSKRFLLCLLIMI